MTNLEIKRDDEFDSLLIEALYAIDHQEDMIDIYLGIVSSDHDDGDAKEIEHRISRLLEEFGPQGITWPQLLIGAKAENDFTREFIQYDDQYRRHFELHGASLGKYLYGLTYDKLSLESLEDGDSSVRLSLAVNNEYILNLEGTGHFDTARFYDQGALDIDSDEPVGSEIVYELQFTADLVYCPVPKSD